MEEFLAPKEVNTGIEVLEAAGFSETGLEVSFDPLISLDGLVAWNKNRGRGSERGTESLHAGPQLKFFKNGKPPQIQEEINSQKEEPRGASGESDPLRWGGRGHSGGQNRVGGWVQSWTQRPRDQGTDGKEKAEEGDQRITGEITPRTGGWGGGSGEDRRGRRCERLAATGVQAERPEAQAGPFWPLQEADTKQKVLWRQRGGKLDLPRGVLL